MISWCFDKIEKLVKPKKPEETELAYLPLTAYQPPAKQAITPSGGTVPLVYVSISPSQMTTATNTYWTTSNTHQNWQYQQAGGGQQLGGLGGAGFNNLGVSYVPGGSGVTSMALLIDANGMGHYIQVDMNFVGMLDQMSTVHKSTLYFGQPTPTPQTCLPEPDFSLDDLGVAEELIEEMNGTPGQ